MAVYAELGQVVTWPSFLFPPPREVHSHEFSHEPAVWKTYRNAKAEAALQMLPQVIFRGYVSDVRSA